MFSKLRVLRLIILVNDWHLLSCNQNELVEDKIEAFASLSNVDFLKSLNINISLSRVTARDRQDTQGLPDTLVVQVFVGQRNDSGSLVVFLDPDLPHLGV